MAAATVSVTVSSALHRAVGSGVGYRLGVGHVAPSLAGTTG